MTRHASSKRVITNEKTYFNVAEQRRPYVTRVRQDYRTFWKEHVGLALHETSLEK